MSAPTPPVPDNAPPIPENALPVPGSSPRVPENAAPTCEKPAGAPPLAEHFCRAMDFNRRADVRYRCGNAPGKITVQTGPGETCAVRLVDISAGGAALESDKRIEPSSFVSIEVPTKDAFGKTTLVMRVTTAVLMPDGTWKIGGTFARKLSATELLAIL